VLGRPALTATAAQLPSAAATARDLRDVISFRLQWRWRKPAAAQLADASPVIARLTTAQLGILAGHLHRTRHHGPLPASLTGGYGIVHKGAITVTAATGGTADLTSGSTWNPAHRLRCAAHRAILIHTGAETVNRLNALS
jgi:hypothetical protein